MRENYLWKEDVKIICTENIYAWLEIDFDFEIQTMDYVEKKVFQGTRNTTMLQYRVGKKNPHPKNPQKNMETFSGFHFF